MSHLACADHKRRVQVLESAKIVHRSDGSECLSMTMNQGDRTVTPKNVLEGHPWPGESVQTQ